MPPSPAASLLDLGLDVPPDRRADVETKHAWVADLLARLGRDALLVQTPANLAWLTSGGSVRSLLGPEDQPVLLLTPQERWLAAPNFEARRMLEEEVDGLGFQVRDWPWAAGREAGLADLIRGRRLAADAPWPDTLPVADDLARARQLLSAYEQACLKRLGQLVGAALEATARGARAGDTERELAGQITHRLARQGVHTVAVGVTADGRSRIYRRHGYTPAAVQQTAVLTATGRKYGLHATATRTFHLGPVPEALQREHLAAARVLAALTAGARPGIPPSGLIGAARRVFELAGFPEEWQAAPLGAQTGRAALERPLTPASTLPLRVGEALAWAPTVGAAACGDTILVTAGEPVTMTPCTDWPTAVLQVPTAEFVVPYILER
jgi:Xaa-Pro aminopeptidase